MRKFIVDPIKGDFKTLNEAAAALRGGSEKTLLMIRPGEYRESVVFECSNLTIEGDAEDLVYICDRNHSRLKDADGREMGTFNSAVVRVDGDNITLKNLTIENKAGIGFKIGPAIALYSDGNGFVCENCKLLAHQDTLFTGPLPPIDKQGLSKGFGPKEDKPRTPSKQHFKNCFIEGDIDFIFGGASVLFEDCTLFSHDMIAEYRLHKMIDCTDNDWDAIQSSALRGYVCAPSTVEGLEYGYLFLNCQFTSSCPNETVYMGRPWRPYGRSYFINCQIGNHIKKELVSDWDNDDNRVTSRFVFSGCKWTGGEPVDNAGDDSFAVFIDPSEAETYVRNFKAFIMTE